MQESAPLKFTAKHQLVLNPSAVTIYDFSLLRLDAVIRITNLYENALLSFISMFLVIVVTIKSDRGAYRVKNIHNYFALDAITLRIAINTSCSFLNYRAETESFHRPQFHFFP